MARRIDAASKAIKSALKIAPEDNVNQNLYALIESVANGQRAQPTSMKKISRSKNVFGNFGNSV